MKQHLVTSTEVARILGMTRQGVARLACGDVGFPEPEAVLGPSRIWTRECIERWAVEHPERKRRTPLPLSPVGVPARSLMRVATVASREAASLNHSWLGTEHLVLALFDEEFSTARVFASLGVSRDEVRSAVAASCGDPFEKPSCDFVKWTTESQLVFERANLKAYELEDAFLRSDHVLLALLDMWGRVPISRWFHERGMSDGTIRTILITITEEYSEDDAEVPSPAETHVSQPRRISRPPDPALRPSPEGFDPNARQPWASAIFCDSRGKPILQGKALRQYFVDRDGHPVLTEEGRPIHVLIDETGEFICDMDGRPIIGPVDIPPYSTLRQSCSR